MAGDFAVSGSQSISNTACALPNSPFPFSAACWFNARSTGAIRTMFGFSTAAAAANFFDCELTAAGIPRIGTAAGGGSTNTPVTSTIVTGKWNFLLVRAAAANNRTISVLFDGGNIEHANATVSRAVTQETVTIGDTIIADAIATPFDGQIGCFWYTNTDVQGDGAATTQNAFLRQLAYGGPFSVPHVAAAVLEYRGMRRTILSSQDAATPDDIYWATLRPNWTPYALATPGTPTLGPHPPLPGWYVLPNDYCKLLTV